MILEAAGTNLFTLPQSTFQSGSWIVQANVTLTPNYAVAPDGSFTACRYQDSALVGDVIYRSLVGSTNTSNKYTASCYAKANGTSEFELRIDMPTLYKATFDLSNGTITQQTAGINAFIENVGNGWYRCSISTTFNDDITNFVVSGDVESANDDILIWGAMCETGTVATSFVYEGTRAADVATSVAYTREHDDAEFSDISDWYNSSGTLYVDFNMAGDTAGSFGNIVQLVEDTSIRTGILSTNASNSLTGLAYRAPDLTYPTIGALTYGTSMKATQTTPDGTNFITSVNGATAVTTPATAIVNPTSMYIGKTISDNYNYTGTFSKIAYYPAKLSNAELQALTENN